MNVFDVNTHDDIRLRSVSQNTKVRRKKSVEEILGVKKDYRFGFMI